MDYKKVANYWKVKDAESKKMSRDQILTAVKKYITENDTCALATGTGSFIRCTPIEYTYHNEAFWMFSEGGEKFIGLESNPNVSIAIYDKYSGFGKLKGMQITAIAELVAPFSEAYIEAANARKISMEALRKLQEPMNLIKITPIRIDFLNSEFKKEGYSSRQSIEMNV